VVDATGAIMGAIALVLFAVSAAWTLPRLDPAVSVMLSGLLWAVSAVTLYGVVVRLRRRKMAVASKAKATK
jgi:hypothetical protein